MLTLDCATRGLRMQCGRGRASEARSCPVILVQYYRELRVDAVYGAVALQALDAVSSAVALRLHCVAKAVTEIID